MTTLRTPRSKPDGRIARVYGGVPPEGGSISSRARMPDYRIDHETGCWEWQKFKLKGYGKVSLLGRGTSAHRVYWEAANEPLKPGEEVHHKCKNPGCVNPEHLERLTEREHDVESFLTDRAGGLTLDDVKEIRRLGRIQGYTSKGVAEMFGIHWRTVDDYWASKRWAAEFDDGPCRPVHTCLTCGVEFIPGRSRKQVYCAKRCANRRKR